MKWLLRLTLAAAIALLPAWASRKADKQQPTALDEYIRSMEGQAQSRNDAVSGSLWSPNAPLLDLGREVRAQFVGDIVTILVVEQASAVASGSTKSARQSSAKSSVSALGGLTRATGPLANLADLGSETSLDGSASTKRETTVSTTLSAYVTHVLPNGALVVEGAKEIQLNSERQAVTVRGVARPTDITSGNVVRSDRLAQLEVKVNGKGVVGDAIRRPNFLYRLLLGLLPF